MFSATFPEEVQTLARKFLHDYVFLAVGPVGGANSDVIQNFLEVDRNKKRDTLLDILKQGGLYGQVNLSTGAVLEFVFYNF